MKKCKICGNKLNKRQKKYCSNKCKFLDKDYNKIRGHKKEKNNKNKRIICNICGTSFKDLHNYSGCLSKHLKEKHNKKFNFKYFKIKNIKENKYLQCPECEWKTIDLLNKSGCFTTHLNKTHNYTIYDFLEKYPKYKNLFKKYDNIIKRTDELKNENNRIKCEICGNYFFKLSNTHLLKHNITPEQYKKKYNIFNTNSVRTINKQIESINKPETIDKIKEKIKETNQKKYGFNSFTQTSDAKKTIREKNLKNSFKKYLISDKFNGKIKLLFSLEEYDGVIGKKYPFKCLQCGNIFNGSLENGRIPRCLKCYPILKGFSKMEKEVLLFIKNILPKEEILENKKNIIKGIEIDIYIPKLKIAIEFNGLFWHSEIGGNKNKRFHLNKTEQCEKKGIRLIQIFEDEWVNNEEIVKHRLKNILNEHEVKKIFARKCLIKQINNEEKRIFLNKFHIQGNDNSSIKLGLYYNEKLISIMTFANYKYSKEEKTTYELSRYCMNYNYYIVGGFNKLLQYFIKNYNVKKIISFADRRWSNINKNVYLSNNFNLSKIVEPSYWYIKKEPIRYHRFNFRKSVLPKKLKYYDDKLSEWENMQLHGYDRIWDCGNLRYEMFL